MPTNRDEIKTICAMPMTGTAKLVAIAIVTFKTLDTNELAAITGESARTVQKARATYLELKDEQGETCESGEPEFAKDAKDANYNSSLAPASRACVETPYGVTLTEDKNPPTPLSGGSPQPDANELARKAFEDGIRLKGGATAKSGRAVQRTKGELDGSQGVLFEDGKLTLLNGTAAMIAEEFPGIDLVAVANKAAPDIAKMSYPSRSDALAQIRKHAQWAIERKAPAAKPVSAAESRLERGKSFYAKLAPKPEAVQ